MRPAAYFAASLLALVRADESVTSSHAYSLSRRDVAAGGGCGPSAANAICASGLCCSASGICGTGSSFCNAPDCQLSFGPACDANQIPTGQDTSKVPRPVIGSVPYGVSISHCTVNGKVALTFDDGPYLYTSQLLDILKKNNVKATFFLVGNNGGKGQIEQASTGYPATIQRMYSEGHQIGSHSWSHQNMSSLTAQQRHDQIVRNEIALTDILGFFPTYFRPPYTQCPADCLKDLGELGYHVLNYDIDTRDWQGDYTYAQNTYNNILTQHSPGSSSWISLAHDIQPNTVHAFAQYMIDHARSLGYEPVTVGECLGDPEANCSRVADEHIEHIGHIEHVTAHARNNSSDHERRPNDRGIILLRGSSHVYTNPIAHVDHINHISHFSHYGKRHTKSYGLAGTDLPSDLIE